MEMMETWEVIVLPEAKKAMPIDSPSASLDEVDKVKTGTAGVAAFDADGPTFAMENEAAEQNGEYDAGVASHVGRPNTSTVDDAWSVECGGKSGMGVVAADVALSEQAYVADEFDGANVQHDRRVLRIVG